MLDYSTVKSPPYVCAAAPKKYGRKQMIVSRANAFGQPLCPIDLYAQSVRNKVHDKKPLRIPTTVCDQRRSDAKTVQAEWSLYGNENLS